MTITRLFQFPPGSVIVDQLIPNSVSGGNWPHKVDFYIPAGAAPKRAMMCLGGAKHEKLRFARNLRLLNATPLTPANVNWNLINAANIVFAVPQGQACIGVDPLWGAGNNLDNPHDVDTRNVDYPTGISTWSNGFMYSGQNDKQFLLDCKNWMLSTWASLTLVSLFGHSNGGMMTKYMELFYPTQFRAFLTVSGPTPIAWSSTSWPTVANIRPSWQQYGRLDDVLGIYGGVAGAGDHWLASQLYQQPAQLSVANVAGSVVLGTWTPALSGYITPSIELQSIMDAYATSHSLTPETYNYTDAVTTTSVLGTLKEWSYLGGNVTLRLLSNSDHSIGIQQQDMHSGILAAAVKWIISLA